MEKYKLVKIDPDNFESFELFYNWNLKESNRECYTCRPVKEIGTFRDYCSTVKRLLDSDVQIFTLYNDTHEALGKITLFDYNPRNHSAEFGYYLPEVHRGKGYGFIMMSLFIKHVFDDEQLCLNKLYATTSSNNNGSIKILEKCGFELDGRIREHYWINELVYDQLHYSLLRKDYLKHDHS